MQVVPEASGLTDATRLRQVARLLAHAFLLLRKSHPRLRVYDPNIVTESAVDILRPQDEPITTRERFQIGRAATPA